MFFEVLIFTGIDPTFSSS